MEQVKVDISRLVEELKNDKIFAVDKISRLEKQLVTTQKLEKEIAQLINKCEKMEDVSKELTVKCKKIKTVESQNETLSETKENYKREKDHYLRELLKLKKQLGEKQSEIQQLNHVMTEKTNAYREEPVELRKQIQELREEIDYLEDMIQVLFVKERIGNDEFQDARAELIKILRDKRPRNPLIGVKRVGELNEKPFRDACKMRSNCKVQFSAAELTSKWENELRDPNWHPYRIINVGDKCKEIIAEDDEKLRALKEKLGQDAYDAVRTTLIEINQYNPNGRYPVLEL